MTAPNTKKRVEHLRSEARRILDESNIDITQKVKILPLAKQMMDDTECGIDAAKRHIAQAVRRKRGEHVKARWGGKRYPSGGRPKKDE